MLNESVWKMREAAKVRAEVRWSEKMTAPRCEKSGRPKFVK